MESTDRKSVPRRGDSITEFPEPIIELSLSLAKVAIDSGWVELNSQRLAATASDSASSSFGLDKSVDEKVGLLELIRPSSSLSALK